MKPFAYVDEWEDLLGFQRIPLEMLLYLKNQTDLIQVGARGWHFLNTVELLAHCPELAYYFRRHKLLVRNSAITISYDNTDLPIHVDEPPVIAKINIPVCNTRGWLNMWYDISQEEIDSCPKIINQFDKEVPDLSQLSNPRLLSAIDSLERPIVFNSAIPHSVYKGTGAKTPRIVASFTFHNEPRKWLE